MDGQEAIKEIISWLDEPVHGIPEGTDQERGYKLGIMSAKIAVSDILRKHGCEPEE